MTYTTPLQNKLKSSLSQIENILAVITQEQKDNGLEYDQLCRLINLKESIETLHVNDSNFQVLAEANLMGMAFADINGNVTYINNEMLRMMGYVRGDFAAGRINWEKCLAPEYRSDTGTWLERLMNQEVQSVHEWIFIRPDGGRTPVVGTAARVRSNEESQVIIALDLTRMREAESSRWKSDQRLRMVADNLNIGIFEWDLSKNNAFWENEQMYRIFGHPREDGPLTFSEFVERIVYFHDRQPFVRAFTQAKNPGNIFVHSCRIQRQKDKGPSWVEITGKFYKNHSDSSVCMIGLVKDISESKQYEQTIIQINDILEQRAQERTVRIRNQTDRLRVLANRLGRVEQKERNRLAGVLHDHIQPLVVGARMQIWEILRKNDIDGVHETARKIEGILEETLAELRSLTVEMSPSAILNDGLMGGLKWVVAYMEKKFNFTVELIPDNDIDPISENTCFLIFECIKELLFNAVKHSGENHARITADRTNDHKIRITVSDNGKGFDLDHVTKTQDSMCIGLFSIQERLKDIGGRVLIESEPGRGATFILIAPAGEKHEKAPPPMDRRKSDKKNAPPISARTQKDRVGILIVDDHKLLREGLTGLLQMEPDFEVLGEAADAQTAIALAESLLPDVVIMDVNLGDTNGVDATEHILSQNPHLKVIALSMHSDKRIINAMYHAGATAFLNKSIPSDELIAKIRESISEG